MDYQTILMYVGVGVMTVFLGYIKNVLRGEKTFKPRIAVSTIAFGGIAGLVVGTQGGTLDSATIAAAAAALVPIADSYWNKFAPEQWGGKSPADFYGGDTSVSQGDREEADGYVGSAVDDVVDSLTEELRRGDFRHTIRKEMERQIQNRARDEMVREMTKSENRN